MSTDDEPAAAAPLPVVRVDSNLGYVAYGPAAAPEGIDQASSVRPAPLGRRRPLGALTTAPGGALHLRVWAVALASLVLPGSGHWALGRRTAGALVFAVAVATAVTSAAHAAPALVGVLGWAVLGVGSAALSGVAAHRTRRVARQLLERS